MTRTITRGPVFVTWWPEEEPHGHQVIISLPGEVLVLDGEALEEFAGELAEAIGVCHEGRHNGHGRTHSHQDQENASREALFQLTTRDYDGEWEAFQQAVRERRLWKGPVPKSVIFYDADKRPLVAIKDERTGLPLFYKAKKGLVEEMMPPPDFKTAHIDPSGTSWVRKRMLKPGTRWRRLRH